MTELADPPRPDTADMVSVHKVFRQALQSAPDLVGSASRHERVEIVASFYGNVLDFLDIHHEGEDLLVWPRLLERCGGDSPTVSRIAAQHQDVTPALHAATALVGPWAASGDAADGRRLIDALAEVERVLIPHLDEEESTVLPLCAEYLSAPEWGELPAHGLGNFRGDKIWLILGLIRENMTQHQRDEMLAHMPPPAVEMWTSMGNAAFDAFISELREGPTA